jgi:hypothetical protein
MSGKHQSSEVLLQVFTELSGKKKWQSFQTRQCKLCEITILPRMSVEYIHYCQNNKKASESVYKDVLAAKEAVRILLVSSKEFPNKINRRSASFARKRLRSDITGTNILTKVS